MIKMNKRDFKADHFKNMEELLNTIDTWLDNENLYGTLYDDFNRFFDTGAMEEMYYYIKQLQNNWNELKKWLEEQPIFDYIAPVDIKRKMREIEEGINDSKRDV